MTESEAKGFIQGKLDCMNKRDVFVCKYSDECDSCQYCYSQGTFREQNEAFSMAIKALEEVQQYRAIGTPEELQALEKQIPKKPILKHDVSVMHINRGNQPHEWKRLESDNWHCPECDSFVGERVYVHSKVHDQRKKKYCDNCGQKLDWSDEE